MPSVVCSCGKTIETQPQWEGSYIRCGGCASKVYVPRPEAPAPAPKTLPVAAAPTGEDQRPCPFCAELIRKEAVKCRWCGQSLAPGIRPATAVPRTAPTDSGGTLILVMGILGWAICGIFHPIAWAMGANHEAKCREMGIEPSGAAKAGKILGMIGTIILGIVVVLIGIVAVAGGLQS